MRLYIFSPRILSIIYIYIYKTSVKANMGLCADSIFFDNERTLFATFKYVGEDFEGDMQRMKANPKVREWWALTDGMQVCSSFNHFIEMKRKSVMLTYYCV